MTTQKRERQKKNLTRDLKNLGILPENSAEGRGSRRECCWGYISICENTPGKLLQLYLKFQGRAHRVRISCLQFAICETFSQFANECLYFF